MSPASPARQDSAPATVEPNKAIVQILNQYRPVVAKLLAKTGTSEETFIAQIGNALRATPKLWACDPPTVLGAALRSAQLGMAPNDGNNLCWIIPYKTTATWQLGYGGVLELARRATPGITFEGRAVYPNDLFDVDFGRTDQPWKHRPAISRGKRGMERGGPARAWYVVARYPDGREHMHYLDREGVEYHRSFSKQPDGEMWAKSYDAAALKSVVLDMKRWLPASPQLAQAIAADEQVHDVRTMNAGEITHTRDDPGEQPPTTPDDAPEAPVDDEDARWVAEAQGDPT